MSLAGDVGFASPTAAAREGPVNDPFTPTAAQPAASGSSGMSTFHEASVNPCAAFELLTGRVIRLPAQGRPIEADYVQRQRPLTQIDSFPT